MQRYDLVLRKVVDNPGMPDDGDFQDLVLVTGPAAACLAVAPLIESILSARSGSVSPTPTPAAPAETTGPEFMEVSPEVQKRKRRTKAEMAAARAAEAAGGAPAGEDDDEVVEVAGEPVADDGVPDEVPADAFVAASLTASRAVPAAAPYNPFA